MTVNVQSPLTRLSIGRPPDFNARRFNGNARSYLAELSRWLSEAETERSLYNEALENQVTDPIIRKFAAVLTSDHALPSGDASWDDIDGWTSLRADQGYSFTTSSGILEFFQTGNYDLGYNLTMDRTSGTSADFAKARLVEDVGAGYVLIKGTEMQGFTGTTTAEGFAALSAQIARSFNTGDKVKLQGANGSTSQDHQVIANSCSFWITKTG